MLEKSKTSATSHKAKRNILLLSFVLIIIAVIVTLLYLLVWRYNISTDDAYVSGNTVQVTPQISGTVKSIHVDNTDQVKQGDVLLTLDDADMQIAFEQAKANLANAVKTYHTQVSQIAQSQATIEQAQAAEGQAKAKATAAEIAYQTSWGDYQRRAKLAGTNAISKEDLKHAKDTLESAKADRDAAQAALNTTKVEVEVAKATKDVNASIIAYDLPLAEQPDIKIAIAQLRTAWLNLQRTRILAPVDGQIANRNIQLGQTTSYGTALMSVIPLDNLWVDANFKESQLKNIRVGQKVTMTADLYGNQVTFNGIVQGISAGTGSAFAVLPAENATGNWIKIVQRVPVRIALNADEIKKHPLRIGLSMNVNINRRDRQDDASLLTQYNSSSTLSNTVIPNPNGAEPIIHDLLNTQ